LTRVDAVIRQAMPVQTRLSRPALLGGWFQANLAPSMVKALSDLAGKLGDVPIVELDDVDRARSAAFLITAYEGGHVHRDALASDALSYDPATRDRLIAGASLPASSTRRRLRTEMCLPDP
jgi:aspartyl-tRNA(Asn)/glutamyl-tRNA(Gln) amidotransferase subunit A